MAAVDSGKTLGLPSWLPGTIKPCGKKLAFRVGSGTTSRPDSNDFLVIQKRQQSKQKTADTRDNNKVSGSALLH